MWIILGLVVIILGVTQFYKSGDLVEIRSVALKTWFNGATSENSVDQEQELVEITLKPEALSNAAISKNWKKAVRGASMRMGLITN